MFFHIRSRHIKHHTTPRDGITDLAGGHRLRPRCSWGLDLTPTRRPGHWYSPINIRSRILIAVDSVSCRPLSGRTKASRRDWQEQALVSAIQLRLESRLGWQMECILLNRVRVGRASSKPRSRPTSNGRHRAPILTREAVRRSRRGRGTAGETSAAKLQWRKFQRAEREWRAY